MTVSTSMLFYTLEPTAALEENDELQESSSETEAEDVPDEDPSIVDDNDEVFAPHFMHSLQLYSASSNCIG